MQRRKQSLCAIVSAHCDVTGHVTEDCYEKLFRFPLSNGEAIRIPVESAVFSVTSLALGLSYDCLSASEVSLTDAGKVDIY